MKRLLLLIFSLMFYVNGWGQPCNFSGGGMSIQGPNGSVCPFSTNNLTVQNAPNNSTYLWSTGATSASISVSPATTTTYTVTVTCQNGNTATQNFQINVNGPNITINPSNPTISCGGSVQLQAQNQNGGGGGTNYLWLHNNSNNNQVTVSPTTTTTYFVVGTRNGCSDTASVTVTVSGNLPTITISPNGPLTICKGTSVSLNATGAGQGGTYQWQNGPNSNIYTVTPNSNTTYTVFGTNASGCSSSASVQVNLLASPNNNMGGNFSICGTSAGASTNFTFSNNSTTIGTNSNYQIDWGDGTTPFSGTSWNILTHSYSVGSYNLIYTVTGQNGCTSTSTQTVFYGNNPAGTCGLVNNNFNVCQGDSLAFGWSGNWLSNPIGTTYIVQFTDGSSPIIFNHPPPAVFYHVFDSVSCGSTWSNGAQIRNNAYGLSYTIVNPCDSIIGSAGPCYVSAKPTVDFTVASDIICVNTSDCFTNTSYGGANISGGVCTILPNVWKISPSTGWTLPVGSLGNTQGIYDPNQLSLWLDGSDTICPIFNTPGQYTITLITGSRCGIDSISKTICVVGPPTPGFTSLPSLICAPDTLFLNNTTILNPSCDSPTYNWTINKASFTCPADSTKDTTFVNNTSLSSFSPNVIINNQGIYNINLSVTNVCGTYTAPQQSITVKRKPIASISLPPTLCVGQSITPTSTYQACGDTVSFSWIFQGGTPSSSTLQNPGPITFNSPGTFHITLTVTNSCGSITKDSTLIVYPLPVPVAVANPYTICAGQSTQLSVQNPQNFNSISWSPATGLSSITGSPIIATPATTTTYTATVVNAAGCSASDTVKVNVNPLPTPVATGSTICAGLTTTIIGSGGGTYLWSTGATTQNVNVTLTTTSTYTLTVTNSFGCTATDTAIVNVLSLPTVNAGPSITLCNQPIPTTLTGYSPAGGTWTGPNVTSGGVFTPNGTGLFILTYTYTDGNGCINNDTMSVNVIIPQIANAGTGFNTCQSNTSINLIGFTPAGGTWSGNNVTSTGVFTPSQLGLSILTYSYGSGTCVNTDTIQIIVNPLPTITSNSGSICPGGSITLTAIGGVSYSWNTSPIHNYDTLTVSPTVNTNYIVTGADANGCVNKDTSVVSIISAPSITNPTSQSLCSGSNSTLVQWTSSLGPTSTYTWTLQSNTNVVAVGGTIPTNGTGNLPSMQLATGSAQGTLVYTATATGNGCTGQPFTYTIYVNPLPNVNAGSDKTICSGLSATLNGSSTTSSVSYSWSPTTGLSSSGVASPTVSLTSTTVNSNAYVLTVTDANGCTKTDTVKVNVNPLPTITSNSGSICPGGSITLTAIGGVSYSWNTTPLHNYDTLTVSPTVNTNYIVTGTDANGCVNKDTSVVSIISAPSITNPTSQSLCSGSNSTLVQWTSSLGPTSTYTWTLQSNTNVVAVGGTIPTNGTSNLPSMQLATTGSVQGTLVYTATATGNGCTGQPFTYTIYLNPLPNVSAGSDKTICSGLSTTLNGSSTTASVSYVWNPITGLSNSTIATPTVSLTSTAATTNTYVLTVTDANSCTKTDTVKVNVNPLPTIISNSGSICPGGSITLTASGGVSYSWNTTPLHNYDTLTVSPLVNTNYIVTGTDTNGCINKDTSIVSIISAPSITNPTSQSLCSGSNSTSVLWTSSLGPTSTYTWTLQNNTNVIAVSGTIATNGTSNLPSMQLATTGSVQGSLVYTATATGNGCTGQPFTYTIYVNPLPNVSAGSDKTICSGLSATLNGSSTTASVSYAWSPITGLSNSTIATPTVSLTSTAATTNTYVLTVTDANSCTKTDTVKVNVNPLPTIISNSGSICPGGSILLTAIGGVSYSWNTTPVHNYDTLTVSPILNANYIVTGTDINGCFNKDTSIVNIISAPSITSPIAETICSETSSSLVQWTSNLGVATVYNWTLQSNTNVLAVIDSIVTVGTGDLPSMQLSTSGSVQGTLVYTATATGNGCIGQPFTYTIYVNPLPNVSAGSDKTICSGLSTTFNGSSTTASVSYSWNPIAGLSNSTIATPTVSLTSTTATTNTYVLTVTDANSCTKTDTVKVYVNPLPTITSNSGSICPGGSILLTAIGGVSYSWNTTPVHNYDTLTVSPILNANYIVTGTDINGCINKDTSIVSIISAPSITSPIAETICSETSSSLVQWTSNLGVATVYNWTLQANSNVVAIIDSIVTVGTGDLPSMQLSTTGIVQGTLVYTATATGNGCVGQPFTYTIYVTPLPIISVAAYDTTICSNDAITLNFSSQIPNTSYQWYSVLGDSISIVPTTGTGSTISQTLFNYGTDLDSVVYTITPRANNCDGLPINVTVYVQPVPHVTFSDPNQVLCDSSTTTSVNLNSTVSNVVYSWSLNANGITGFITSSGAGTIPSETIFLPAGAITNVSAIYTTSASIDGCPGPDSLYSVTLYPIANITGPANQTICSGQNITSVNWQSNVNVTTTYNWHIINSFNSNVIGYPDTIGFDDLNGWTLFNPNPPNPNPDSIQIQVIPYTHPTPTDSCQGIPFIYTIVVNPAPSVILSTSNDTICSGEISQVVTLSSQTNNAIITWSATAHPKITGLSNNIGTDTIYAETLINSDSIPHIVDYTISIITSGTLGCPGIPQHYYVVVNPSPLVTFNQPNQVICSSSSTLPVIINTTSPNTVISWSCNPPAFISGLTSTSGNDTIPSFNLLNNSFNPITITFAAWGTTTSESCVGDTNYYTITVNPIPPAFASPADTTICSNTSATIQLSSPVAGTTFSWTYVSNPYLTGASNGSGSTINQTLINSDTFVQTMTYLITPNASNCPGSPITALVHVNPSKPVVFNLGNQSLCSNETSIPVYLSSPIDSVTFSWTCTPPAGITGTISSGTDSIPSQNLFSNSTVIPIPVIYNAIATYDGCPGPSTPYTITVNPTPVPSFTLDTVICKNVSYVFGNTTSTTASTTYLWDFGDGVTSTTPSPSHAYNAGGIYTITLSATNQYGCDSSYTRTVKVVEPPVAQFVESPHEGCGPLSVTFTDQSTGYLVNPTYNWNFGNGTTANTQGPHTVVFNASLYQDTLYLVTQTVGNLCGSTTYIDSVIVHPTPTAYFGTNLSSGCSPLTISFSNNSYGLPTSFLWNFGDGTTDTSRVPAPHTFYAYTQDTVYYISLIAINDCGTNTYVDSVLVHPNTTNAFFNTSPDKGCAPLTVTFTNYSIGGTIYAWDFGDGNVSNQFNTTHTYLNPGIYTASFIITNNCSYDTAYVSIEVWPQPTLSFTSSVDTVCINSAVQFNNTSTTPLTNIVWDFGDGTGSVLSNPSHTYLNAGTFLVSMIGIGGPHGCSDTTYKYIVVKPLPIAAYDSLYFEGCQPFVANFINQSTGGVSGVLWDFGDGNTSAAFNATHVYLNAGIFYPLLTVQTQYGCVDTARGEVIVHPKPTSLFTFSPDSSCGAPIVVQFNNQSVLGSGANWSFTDGQTSTQISPAMTFTQVGTLGVQLIAISDFGCKDTSADQFVVYPKPIADIAVVDPRGCEDFTPVFINNSTNAISYSWTFGDGFTSTDQLPVHTYTDDGNYIVTLAIEGLGGCKDSTTLSSTITVIPGPTADFSYTPALNPTNYGWIYFTNLSVYDVSWHWNFDDGSNSTLENPDHQYNANGVYNVELIAYAANGCTDTIVKPIKPTYFDGLFVPNAFAPDKGNNGDMYRVFYPQGKSLTSYHVWVYDTFGILIWESTALKNGSPSEWWDGTRDGSLLPSDVYIWKVEATFENGDVWPGQFNPEQGLKRITGNVTLIR